MEKTDIQKYKQPYTYLERHTNTNIVKEGMVG